MTKAEVNSRALLYVTIAVLSVVSPAMTDETVNWPSVAVQSALGAAVALRAFVDKSISETEPMRVEATGIGGGSVEVTETVPPAPGEAA